MPCRSLAPRTGPPPPRARPLRWDPGGRRGPPGSRCKQGLFQGKGHSTPSQLPCTLRGHKTCPLSVSPGTRITSGWLFLESADMGEALNTEGKRPPVQGRDIRKVSLHLGGGPGPPGRGRRPVRPWKRLSVEAAGPKAEACIATLSLAVPSPVTSQGWFSPTDDL